ncbi:MAG: hypothetical protein ACK5FV_02820 [Bacteroidota bacterium]
MNIALWHIPGTHGGKMPTMRAGLSHLLARVVPTAANGCDVGGCCF